MAGRQSGKRKEVKQQCCSIASHPSLQVHKKGRCQTHSEFPVRISDLSDTSAMAPCCSGNTRLCRITAELCPNLTPESFSVLLEESTSCYGVLISVSKRAQHLVLESRNTTLFFFNFLGTLFFFNVLEHSMTLFLFGWCLGFVGQKH